MIPLSLALAAIVGFAVQKGGLCAVLAVREVLDERRAGRFIAFFVGVAVVVVISTPLRWAGALPAEPAQRYRIAVTGLTGAALFGIGAVVNGTCAFGSIAHLGRGETSFLAMPAGLAIGFFIADLLPPAVLPVTLAEAHPLAVLTPLSLTVVGVAAAAVCIAGVRLWQGRERGPGRWSRLVRQRWPTTAAVGLIGLAAVLLYGTFGAWVYTEGLHRALSGVLGDCGQAALFDIGLFAAILGGSALGAACERTLALRRPVLRQMLRSLLGGTLMGVGVVLVPGGNDGLILQAMPDLAAHGWAGYGVMVAAIAVCLTLAGRRQ
jgi:uncharacterized protein